ncbi:hypothetical protein D046_8295 [Vibrio parahaemolyticus V-223/04]|nr:hypothetical protein D046_8295 [Vibrio parahaemolyticus V-223/04]
MRHRKVFQMRKANLPQWHNFNDKKNTNEKGLVYANPFFIVLSQS